MQKTGLISGLFLILLLIGCGQSKEEQERAASKKATQSIKSECVLSNPAPESCNKK